MNSKEKLAGALEALLACKNLDDIPVSEIVACASVSRKTFYRNFKDKYDLAAWYFARLYEGSFGRIKEGVGWEEALLSHLEIYEEKHPVLKNAYESRDVNGLRACDILLTKRTFEEYLAGKGVDTQTEDMRFAIEIAARGGTDCIIEWLLGGMKMDKARLASLLKRTLPGDILRHIG
ncbi:TetR-like C-terminal domain-containing protein [Anaerotalea alkaliphila]|uniref:TetR family transcriptional regulator n=1 Tax=Anaerotalea alkaliphila TaxID=2662126 RepID=A0A7X5HUV0_9FIRM|nr:TetR-like C-terminal domain-containing protein [Anaerotalea alkaliphila]NDL66806.1 TetR family transcriptional regulator [Anaerotalea alkaliphila]